MNKNILLYQLKSLLEAAPDFSFYTAESEAHLHWMNSIYSVIYQWKPFPAIAIASSIEFMPVEAERKKNIECIFNVAHHACSELRAEIDAAASSTAAKKSSADNDLATLLSMANDHLFIVDQVCDSAKLHFYLNNLQELVHLRLLVKEISTEAITELENIKSKTNPLVEVKIAQSISENLFFIDDLNCWGAVKDGYPGIQTLSEAIAPLLQDKALTKRDHYEASWDQAIAPKTVA